MKTIYGVLNSSTKRTRSIFFLFVFRFFFFLNNWGHHNLLSKFTTFIYKLDKGLCLIQINMRNPSPPWEIHTYSDMIWTFVRFLLIFIICYAHLWKSFQASKEVKGKVDQLVRADEGWWRWTAARHSHPIFYMNIPKWGSGSSRIAALPKCTLGQNQGWFHSFDSVTCTDNVASRAPEWREHSILTL